MTHPQALAITTAATFGHTHTPAGLQITRDRLRLARMVLLGLEITQ